MNDAEIRELREALAESVKLQSHYAGLLNQYDGGERLTFASAEEWVERLRVCRARTSGSWPAAPPADSEVYSRPECIFNYCPDPEACRQWGGCRNPSRRAP